jgi:hypothetical protein
LEIRATGEAVGEDCGLHIAPLREQRRGESG